MSSIAEALWFDLADCLRFREEDFLGSTERKGWLACQTAGFRLKVGGDVVALAK